MSSEFDQVDFLGIGVQKGGTTWIYHKLSQHPQVVFPAGKELHFWDRASNSQLSGVEWKSRLTSHARISSCGRPIRTGEITPAYAILPLERIKALAVCSPDVRLFMSLRNPMERAWSAALMALAHAQLCEHEVSDQWFIDHFRSQASRQRGAYSQCLENWWQVFPQEQLLILLCDAIHSSPLEVLCQLAAHIDIEKDDFLLQGEAGLSQVIVPFMSVDGRYKQQSNYHVRPSLVEPLVEQYAPEIQRLEILLGRNLSFWNTNFLGHIRSVQDERWEVDVASPRASVVNRITPSTQLHEQRP